MARSKPQVSTQEKLEKKRGGSQSQRPSTLDHGLAKPASITGKKKSGMGLVEGSREVLLIQGAVDEDVR